MTFVGWASFVPDNTMYENEPNLDKKLIDACAASFSGSVPANTDLILSNKISGLPDVVPDTHVIAPACTGNKADTPCASGDYRFGFDKKTSLKSVTTASLKKMHLHRASWSHALCVTSVSFCQPECTATQVANSDKALSNSITGTLKKFN